jgi:hypothetical protein
MYGQAAEKFTFNFKSSLRNTNAKIASSVVLN